MVQILLARHGETEWNLSRRFQGHLDSPLTDRGREQAALLAERLAREPVSAVYSSDLGRAMDTAQPISLRHGLPLVSSPLLREIDCGHWTGQAKEELALRHPEAIERYRIAPSLHRMPGGESLADVQARGSQFLRDLQPGEPGSYIVLITHHIVVETLLARALGLSLADLWLTIPAGNCFLSELTLIDDDLKPVTVYDGTHLGAAAQPSFEGERVA
ncbi:MAG: histidine phosphatase family protein [Chloroflexota bacterium]